MFSFYLIKKVYRKVLKLQPSLLRKLKLTSATGMFCYSKETIETNEKKIREVETSDRDRNKTKK